MFIAGFSRLCHASSNSRAYLVFAIEGSWFLFSLIMWALLLPWFGSSDRGSSRFTVFLSVIRDLTVFDVFSMSLSWHGIVYTTLRLSSLSIWFLCLAELDLGLFMGLCATFKLCLSRILYVISEIL